LIFVALVAWVESVTVLNSLLLLKTSFIFEKGDVFRNFLIQLNGGNRLILSLFAYQRYNKNERSSRFNKKYWADKNK
jgi:hypothetical protein